MVYECPIDLVFRRMLDQFIEDSLRIAGNNNLLYCNMSEIFTKMASFDVPKSCKYLICFCIMRIRSPLGCLETTEYCYLNMLVTMRML